LQREVPVIKKKNASEGNPGGKGSVMKEGGPDPIVTQNKEGKKKKSSNKKESRKKSTKGKGTR